MKHVKPTKSVRMAEFTNLSPLQVQIPAGIYLFKANKWKTKTKRGICSKLTRTTPECHH